MGANRLASGATGGPSESQGAGVAQRAVYHTRDSVPRVTLSTNGDTLVTLTPLLTPGLGLWG